MANIKLKDLKPISTQLFSDAENFLNELSQNELHAISQEEVSKVTGGSMASHTEAPPPPNPKPNPHTTLNPAP